ncbi:thioredoxin domain-containing protein [Mariniluteicoccus endophyticus]
MSKHKPARDGSRRAQLRAAQIAEAKRKKNQRIVFGVVGALLALILIGGVSYAVYKFNEGQAKNIPPSATAKKDGMIPFKDKAKQGAPVVSLYFDYQCPACKQFEDKFGPTLEEMANNGEIQLEYHTMKFLDINLRNDASERAANAAVCADTVGAYAKYHDAVFSHQPREEGEGYTDDQLTGEYAQQAGITGDKLTSFQTCYKQRQFKAYVNKMDEQAGKDGITGTPSLRVNGKTLDNKKLTADVNSLRTEIQALAK